MARSVLFVLSCIGMNMATVFANPADPLSLNITAPTPPNLPLNGTVPNFKVECNGAEFGRNLNPNSCADVQSRIPTLGDNVKFGMRGRRGISVVTPWRWISCKFSDVQYRKSVFW